MLEQRKNAKKHIKISMNRYTVCYGRERKIPNICRSNLFFFKLETDQNYSALSIQDSPDY